MYNFLVSSNLTVASHSLSLSLCTFMLRRTMSTKLMRPEILFDTRQNRIIGPLKVVGFIALISIVFVTGQREDSICYLEDSTPACTNHRLGLACGKRQIAILSAEYAYATNCTCKKSKCSTCRSVGRGIPFTPSAQCLSDYRSEDYWNIVTKCSKIKGVCFIPPPRRRYYNECKSFTTFSRIQYRCVDAKYEINMCGGDKQSRNISLFYNRSAFHNESLCMCNITGSNPQSTDTYNITALDIRMGDKNDAELILTSPNNDFKVRVTEKKIRPNTPLGTSLSSETFLKLQLNSNYKPDRIWILVESNGNSDVRVKCAPMSLPDSNTPKTVKMTTETTYAIVGGTVVGVLLITVLVVLCRRKRSTSTDISSSYGTKVKNTETEHVYAQVDAPSPGPNPSADQHLDQNATAHATEPSLALAHSQNSDAGRVMSVHQSTANTNCEPDISQEIQKNQSQEEDCYNCLETSAGGKITAEADYDTVVSASKAVKQCTDPDDYYSYDHLGTSTTTTATENDYDTAFHGTDDEKT